MTTTSALGALFRLLVAMLAAGGALAADFQPQLVPPYRDPLSGDNAYPIALQVNQRGEILGGGNPVFRWDANGGISAAGDLGGGWAAPTDMNDRGQVVGFSGVSWDVTHAFLWNPGERLLDVGTSGGRLSFAQAVNNRGEVVGRHEASSVDHGFYWSPTAGFVDVGEPGLSATLTDINDCGVAVGNRTTPAPGNPYASAPFVWTRSGGMRDLPVPSGYDAWAAKINNRGEVIGGAWTSPLGRSIHAVFWDKDGRFFDLGTLGGDYSVASDLNEAGQVVGSSETSLTPALNETHAFVWSAADGLKDLGTLGGPFSAANAINNLGEVVGFSSLDRDQDSFGMRAFYWAGQGLVDLGTLERRSEALDVNDGGLIVGWSEWANGGQPGVFWQVPGHPPAPPVSLPPCGCGGDGFGTLIDAIRGLRERGLILAGLERSLLAKVLHAQKQVAKGKTKPALGSLKAFINEVRAAVKARRLPQSAGSRLRSEAEAVRAALAVGG